MAQLQSYSQGDIMRYLQHKMSPQEMHDFEKALMNDPFLADSLEGFLAGDQRLAEEHLASIESSFEGNVQKAKVIRITTGKTAWWKIAVVLIIIVSAGMITYFVLNDLNLSTRHNPIAKATPPIATPEKRTVAPPDTAYAMVEKSRKRYPDIPSAPAQGVPGGGVLQKNSRQASPRLTIKEQGVEEPYNAMKINIDSPGLAVNNNGGKHKKVEMSDSTGEDQLTLAEEVVTTLARRKNQLQVVAADSAVAEPVEGWVYFDQYLSRHLDSLNANGSLVSKQYYELAFSIDKQGRPTEVNVPAALDKITAARIIELLANGPRWAVKKAGKKVKITIQF